MNAQEQELVERFRRELENCFEIAKRLDEANPTLERAFSGSPSDHIWRQLVAAGIVTECQ